MVETSINEKQLVIFKLTDEEFGVDISEVREIIKMEEITKVPNTANFINGVINLRGKVIVVVDLSLKLNLPAKESDKNTRIIIIEFNDTNLGMIVDSATEVLRVQSDKIEAAPKIITDKIGSHYLEGVAVLDDRLVILLDLVKIFGGEDKEHIQKAEEMHVNAPTEEKPAEDTKTEPETPKEEEAPEAEEEKPAKEKKPENVHPDFHFVTHEGEELKNIHELHCYIEVLTEEEFQQFVTEEKNDFANWIRDAVKDAELADKLMGIKNKEELTAEILKKIKEEI